MVNYNINHLTQPETQRVLGPIQDDEALFLYSIIKGMRLNRILEIGGGEGYSARNFLQSMDKVNGKLYTVDINPVPILAENHKVIIKNALHLSVSDVDDQAVDLVFFDCHDIIQMDIFHYYVANGIITDNTILALHDTNLHYEPFQIFGSYIPEEGGYAHQPVERKMVNIFKSIGYDIFTLHTTKDKHTAEFPFRHGITVCQKFKELK
jgi:hypothetical protein